MVKLSYLFKSCRLCAITVGWVLAAVANASPGAGRAPMQSQ